MFNCTTTATGRQHGLHEVLATAFEPRGAHPARVSHHGVAADGPRSTCRAPRELAWLCCGPTRGALHPHAVGRGSTAPTLRKVVSTAFERSWRLRSNSVARGPREFRANENRPTAGEAHAVQRGVGVVVMWANARRALPHAISRGSTAQCRDRLVTKDSNGFVQFNCVP